ncbi:MAG: POTRA domain-containing protein [Bacteroidota bacterium]|nr:POTRA domain-containing protein [Bacteroidota bacterium]
MKTAPLIIFRKLSAHAGWLLLFLAVTMSDGQTKAVVRSIQFFQASFFSPRQLAEHIPLKVRDSLSQSSLQRVQTSIVELYRTEGFYFFRFDSVKRIFSVDSQSVAIELYLDEGVRTTISEISFSGNTSFDERKLLPLMETSTGSPMNSFQLESDIQSILTYYSNNGFPFTKVQSDSVRIDPTDSSKLMIHLIIDESAKVYLDEIQVEGNTSTSPNVVAREARLHKGEIFSEEKVGRIRRRLERMQIFSSVSEPQLYVLTNSVGDSLHGGLLITIKEGNVNTFDGIVGYVPPTTPNVNDGYFNGNVFIAMRNLFGTGRKAMVKWVRETEVTQELELQYYEPWVFNIPLSVGILFNQRKQDSSYVKTKINFRGEYAVTEELMFAGTASTESVYPSADLQQFSVFESQTVFAGGEIVYDTRDNLRNPLRGVKYSTAVQQGTKNISVPQNYLYLAQEKKFTIQKFSVDAEAYVSTFFRQVVMLGVHGKQTTSSRLEVSDLYQFGGTTTVRGYRENQFYASKLAWLNLEYRFITGRASSLFGFTDAGYFSRPADALLNITFQEKNIYGYGVGAHVETGLGILSISYALGKGDSFSNGKIHVGIINEF